MITLVDMVDRIGRDLSPLGIVTDMLIDQETQEAVVSFCVAVTLQKKVAECDRERACHFASASNGRITGQCGPFCREKADRKYIAPPKGVPVHKVDPGTLQLEHPRTPPWNFR